MVNLLQTSLQVDLLRLLKPLELQSSGYKGNEASYATTQLCHVLEENGVVTPGKPNRNVELVYSGKVLKTLPNRSECAH